MDDIRKMRSFWKESVNRIFLKYWRQKLEYWKWSIEIDKDILLYIKEKKDILLYTVLFEVLEF